MEVQGPRASGEAACIPFPLPYTISIVVPWSTTVRTVWESSRAKEVLGWSPTMNFREGVALTVDYQREHEV